VSSGGELSSEGMPINQMPQVAALEGRTSFTGNVESNGAAIQPAVASGWPVFLMICGTGGRADDEQGCYLDLVSHVRGSRSVYSSARPDVGVDAAAQHCGMWQ